MKRIRDLLAVSLAALLLGGLMGCGYDCTTMGCDDGVYAVVQDQHGEAVETFSGTLHIDGGEWLIDCVEGRGAGAGYRCAPGGVHFTGLPEEITLSITSGELRYEGSHQPDYESQYVNGEDCGVTCRTATWTLVME